MRGKPESDPAESTLEEARRLLAVRDYAHAEQLLRQVLAARPQHGEALHLLGVVAYFAHQYEEAIALYDRALLTLRKAPGLHNNLGLALQAVGKYTQAVKAFRRSVAASPANASYHLNLGEALKSAGDIDAAFVSFSRALALEPGLADAHFARALCLLGLGRIDEAWRDHEWRSEYDAGRQAQARPAASAIEAQRPTTLPPLDLNGKHILVLGEQGLGDELFFLRYAPAIAAQGAHIAYRGSAKLTPLLAGAQWLDEVIPEGSTTTAHDCVFRVGDLPLVAATLAAVPAPLPLRVPAEAARTARERLAASGSGPYLGITWRAGKEPMAGRPRSLQKNVPVDLLGACIAGWPGTVINLQRNPHADDVAILERASGARTADFSDCNGDLALMLAVLEGVDEYAGVSNTNVHLRAGLAKTTRVLVPFPPEWRWPAGFARSPWFPDCVLYREDERHGWSSPLTALRSDLPGIGR